MINYINQVETGKPRLKVKPVSKAPTKALKGILAAKEVFCKGGIMKLVDIFRICLVATAVLVIAIPMMQGA